MNSERESNRQRIHIQQRSLVRDVWGAARCAPGIVVGVYGLPILMLIAGLLGFIASLVLDTDDATPWALLSTAAALPSYYLLAALYAFWSRYFVRRVRVDAAMPSPGESRASAETLVVTAPAGCGKEPYTPWNPPSSAGRAAEPWPGEFRFRNIALVLAGGGAKGIYQAGAMKAIHEFLRERGAQDRVVSVASTSIGSWNALFWLAGLVDPASGAGGRSLHEQWWSRVHPENLVRPSLDVVPFVGDHLMDPAPWRREFDALFGRPDAAGHAGLQRVLERNASPHFYLTRTNVSLARLAFETNNPAVVDKSTFETHDLDQARLATSIDRIREAAFTSMGIPPLFPYTYVYNSEASAWAEDGGVIDNLPIRLATAFDKIDLIFVLPLNSSYFLPEKPRMIVPRLFRVVDMRGGLQERAALKSIYLFNQRTTLEGGRNPVPAFVITPGQPVQIGTVAFWRIPGIGAAVFDQMYRATRQALDDFFQPQNLRDFYGAYEKYKSSHKLTPPGYVRMAIVDPAWDDGNPFEYETRF